MGTLGPTFDALREAQKVLEQRSGAERTAAMLSAAAAVADARDEILRANARDVEKAREGGMKEALVDRLFLDAARVNLMAEGIENVAALPDPLGRVKAGWTRPNGLVIEQVTVPLGVAAIIYESRPNVTAEAWSLAYKAGCALLLRGSSSALESNRAIVAALKQGLSAGVEGVPGAVALAESGNRSEVDEILTARGKIDVALPRGGRGLIRRVVETARVPVIETGEGNCHIYVEPSADMTISCAIIVNAKTQKPGACNAVETLLVHRAALDSLLAPLSRALAGKCELRCDREARAALERNGSSPTLVVKDAVEEDWATEFLDYVLAVKTVESLDEAIAHINRYGSGHSEAILTGSLENARRFQAEVDAACVYVNASTRFTDGSEFGFGAELGISTQKFHARGPMGLDALTTIKYLILGTGQHRA